MTYEESCYYYETLLKKKYPPSLENVYHLLEELGQPQLSYQVIHVAGTNGKGSTSAYIYQILLAANISVGSFSSPYILKRNEMVNVNGKEIEDREWAMYTQKIKEACDIIVRKGLPHPTPFECYTALALLYFKEKQVKVAVIETGMGGETDATNVFDFPHICVFTSISIDHKMELGETLPLIAKNKSGIIKEGCQVILAPNEKIVCEVIEEKVRKTHSNSYLLRKEAICVTKKQIGSQIIYDISYKERNWWDIRLKMKGKHQINNVITALTAVDCLRKEFPISEEIIREGIKNTYLPCRMEVIKIPYHVIFDAAHNEDSIKQLVTFIQSRYQDYDIQLFFGCLKDKEVNKMLSHLRKLTAKIHLIPIESERGIEISQLQDKAKQYFESIVYVDRPYEIVGKSIERQEPKTLIVCTGSFYFVYPLRNMFMANRRLKKDVD